MIEPTLETGPASEPSLTRRALFRGLGQVTIAAMGTSSLALLGACATPQAEPWADGTYWADGTGWVD